MSPEARLYLDCMTEMKARLFAAYDSSDKHINSGRTADGDFEFGCLQLRKAIELIGFSGMIAEVDAYSSLKSNFQKEWNFAEILKKLQRISSNSFPFRVRRELSKQAGVNWHFVPQEVYAISPDQMKDWHGRLNEHLHAKNPYSNSEDHLVACLRIKSNVTDILALLEDHCFLRSDKSGGFLVALNERDQPVTLFEFEATDNVH